MTVTGLDIGSSGRAGVTRRAFATALGAGCGLAMIPGLSASAAASLGGTASEPIGFSVFRGGELFGRHSVRFSQSASGDLQVDVEIDLEVRIAFVTVFAYRHRNREAWREGRLVTIETETDDNGTPYRLSGRATDAGFAVDGFRGSYIAPADIMPSSYWSAETLGRSQLLDTQRGGLLAVSVAKVGNEAIAYADREVEAVRYRMMGDLTLDLWYTPEGEWAKLAFEARGSAVTYRRERGAPLAAG